MLSFSSTFAAHIVGGDMYYECLGGNDYQITLKVYRDCYSFGPQVADFDAPAYISIYDGAGFEVESINTYFISRVTIPPVTNNPCVTPPADVCVEEAIYTFEVTLGNDPAGYDVVYTRCCRNATITNIQNPSDVGATYTVHIDPNDPVCNSSPSFNEFPPIVICTGEPLNFDHSATDPDGDVLVYELCTPYVGADPNDPQPIPPDPPPFLNVMWAGGYTTLYPLNAAPGLSIDPNTGLLTGTPNATGQFVVGICVNEFRNGVLIGTTRRDFQFNVTPCNYNVEADIPIIDTVTWNTPDVKGVFSYECQDLTVDMINISQSASSYLWDFGDPTTSADTSSLYQPSYTYPDSGQYVVTLIANPSFSCADTVKVIVRVFPGFGAEFDATEVCEGEIVNFTDRTATQYGQVSSWDWTFGDGNGDNTQNPANIYGQGGDYPVTLIARNTKGCRDTITKLVTSNYKPDVLISNTVACLYNDLAFIDQSTVNNATTAVRSWYHNDNYIGGSDVILWRDSTLASNTIKLVVETDKGCIDSSDKAYTVFPLPVITASNDTDMCLGETVQLNATGGERYDWIPNTGLRIPDLDTVDASPTTDTRYIVVVTDSNGCKERDTVNVVVHPLPTVQVNNDTFICEGESQTLVGNTDGISYSWSPGGLLSDSTVAAPFWTPDSTTTFVLTTTNVFGCINKDSTTTEVQHPINTTLAQAPELCEFDTLQLDAQGGKYYIWSPGYLVSDSTIGNPTTSPDSTVSLTVISSNDCPQFNDTLDIDVVVNQLPEVNAGEDTTIKRDEFYQIYQATSTADNYLWTPANGLDDPTLLNPITSPFNTTKYYLTVTDDKGCQNIDTLIIYVDVVDLLVIPNAFSPNNDGHNDVFRIIRYLNIDELLEFNIYNRWGERVFQTNNIDDYWDGTYKGEQQDLSVFVFIVKAKTKDGNVIVRSGNVTLVR